MQYFHVDSRACLRVRIDVSEWFPVIVGLNCSCAMYPRLFNVHMDGVVQEVNVRVLGKGWNCSVQMVAGSRYTPAVICR